MKRRISLSGCIVTVALFLVFSAAYPDAVRISQIDNSMLLLNQRIKVYVSVTDQKGDPVPNLTKDYFSLFESGEQRQILSFERGVNINQGIKLLLIMDNSGSMYWDETGKVKNSTDEKIWRITYAKEAVSSLLNEIKNPMDRVGLISFNVRIGSKIRLTNDKGEIAQVLRSIEKPAEEEAYTELYETLYSCVDELRTYGGRKVIILLSDGQDFPLKDNPFFPRRQGIEGAIRFAQQEGISVFTIGLSARADRENLLRIAEETGGAYFWVYDPAQLRNLYNRIRQQILQEYLLIYSATMAPAEKKPVRVVYSTDVQKTEAERFYFSGTIFGMGREILDWKDFLFIPAAGALLWVLSLCRFEKKKAPPSLAVHTHAGRKTQVHELQITKVKSEVTIGGSPSSDVTISGDPKIMETQARIRMKDGMYTISSRSPITINNRQVTNKVLRSGDLIRLGDTHVVFDTGVVKAEVQKAKKGFGRNAGPKKTALKKKGSKKAVSKKGRK